MPRALPAQLETAMDTGGFTPYFAIGKRTYDDPDTPTTLTGYETLIENLIIYYKYDGQMLQVNYHSPYLPEDDGLTVGEKYYIERGVTIQGTNYTIKTASLRFDDYIIHKQIVTAYFSLFPADEKPESVDGYDTYENVLTALNPNAGRLGTVTFRATPENANHWGYKFFPTGKSVILKSYNSILPLIRQKYLLQATDNSDDDNEDEIEFFHMGSPINQTIWREPSVNDRDWSSICWSAELEIFLAGGNGYFGTSPDGITWNEHAIASNTWTAIAWSPELGIFAAMSSTLSGTSADGETWNTAPSPGPYNWQAMTWAAELSLFVAVASGGSHLYTSPDGETWTAHDPGAAMFGIEWSSDLSLLVAVGQSALYTSPDGTNWTSRTVPAKNWISCAWSDTLTLFAAVANTGEIITSPDGETWTSESVPNSNARYDIIWSNHLALFMAICQTGTGNRLLTSTDGETWEEATTGTDGTWYRIAWSEELKSFCIVAASGSAYITSSIESVDPDHTIEQGDIKLLKDAQIQSFLWRDEAGTIHTSGADTSLIHNLGYLESTDSPPASFQNSDRASLTVGIHLKYKTGDIFELKINDEQTATYLAKVTEILDPNNAIGWRCEIELIERFANTSGGAMPSTIERVAAYTPLVTTNFDGNLDETVNNLQAFADRVDDMDVGNIETSLPAAAAKTTPADGDLFAILDSAASYILKKLTWANIKATLKTYFDTLYSTASLITASVSNFDGKLSSADNTVQKALDTLDDHDHDERYGGLEFDFYLDNLASDIGTYYTLQNTETGAAESNITTASLTDNALIAAFATSPGFPTFDTLSAGVYDIHLHAEKSAGTQTLAIYCKLFERTSGGSESEIWTSETDSPITSKTDVDIHASLASDYILASGSRLVLKVYATVTGLGTAPTAILYMEGTTDSHLALRSTLAALDGKYVKLTGDETIAGVKTFSSFPITPSSAPTTNYQVANKKYVDDNAGGGSADTTEYLINVSVDGSGNITVALKNKNGDDPSSTTPVKLKIGADIISIESALSVTISAGTNTFGAGSAEFATYLIQYFVYIGYNSTDGATIGISRYPCMRKYSDFSTTATDPDYAAISTITNAAATDDYLVIGRFSATLSAGGSYTWSISGDGDPVHRPIFETDTLTYNPQASAKSSMTWTITTSLYQSYKVKGSDVYIVLGAYGTTGGTASNELYLSLPFPTDAIGYGMASRVRDASSGVVPLANGGAYATICYLIKTDNSNFGLGTGRGGWTSGFYPLK